MGGRETLGLFIINIPLAVAQGGVEILFGFVLLYFLAGYGLVSYAPMPSWLSLDGLSPIVVLLTVGFVRAFLNFSSSVVTNMCFETFCSAVRRRIAYSLTPSGNPVRFSVAEASHTLSNLLPKAGNYFFSLSQILTSLLIFMMTIVGLFRLSVPLAGIVLLCLCLFGTPLLLLRKVFQGYSATVYQQIKKFMDRLLKDVRNWEFLRIIGRMNAESETLVKINKIIVENYRKYIFWINVNSAWPQFGAVCVIVLVVVMNQKGKWVDGVLLIPFVYLLSRGVASASDIIKGLGQLQFNWPFVENLISFFERWTLPIEMRAKDLGGIKPSFIRSLEVENITIGRANPLITHISFLARSGDFVCIRGESGKGKTTLLMTLIGLIPLMKGKILWNELPLEQLDSAEFQNHVAYSGADPFLLDASIKENIYLGNENMNYSDTHLWDALKLCGCEFVEKLPGGLDHVLQEGGEGISAGQKQRLSIARALLRKPDVLLLDEATANVDLELEALIINNIKNFLPKTLVLAVSHRDSMMKFATQQLAF